ncbi:MAG: glycosidase [Chitinivibrionales bacterium]|nr:glycosidase [Chitinivibrionales bacterium]MBD3355849.1 glycosidase [Chitinivibrionales bacterium]
MEVERLKIALKPSHSRVLIRPFVPSGNRAERIISRVMCLSEEEVSAHLDRVLAEFADRHHDICDVLLRHFQRVRHARIMDHKLSEKRKLLIGSYFTQEYALESAALFNPSIVLHPDQSGLPAGSVRFILSLRATGEGHISSIVFREGVLHQDAQITLVPPTPYVVEPERIPYLTYDKPLFERKLQELELDDELARRILSALGPTFTLTQLNESITNAARQSQRFPGVKYTIEGIRLLALSNYEKEIDADRQLSELAIFPSAPSQSNGIEDARFVRFAEDDGTFTYFATYSAFDGSTVVPQLLRTSDFRHFVFNTLNGPAVRNKGMALFPRKINGCYAMLSRQDNENIFLMYSDNVHFWYSPEIIMRPTHMWEFVQLGNCGSPIELDEGWLVLSHGVGPMRKYCMGAFLLDKKDPSKVVGRLRKPLLEPNENEREGYVPNVVYTCGAMTYNGFLILPYAMSDYATGFARIRLTEILNSMDD